MPPAPPGEAPANNEAESLQAPWLSLKFSLGVGNSRKSAPFFEVIPGTPEAILGEIIGTGRNIWVPLSS